MNPERDTQIVVVVQLVLCYKIKLMNNQFLMGNEKGQSHYERMILTDVEEFAS